MSKWYWIAVAAFFTAMVLVMAGCGKEAEAEELRMEAIPGQYGALCPLDPDKFFEVKNYKEVNSWVNSDGQHLWVMYENDTSWLLTMKNALSQKVCFFDMGELDKKES
jgi:hypothetical protein